MVSFARADIDVDKATEHRGPIDTYLIVEATYIDWFLGSRRSNNRNPCDSVRETSPGQLSATYRCPIDIGSGERN